MSKTYRVAVIGRTGRGDYGHGIDTVWKELPNVELAAVADDNKEGLAKAAQKLSLTKTYADYRQMLDEVKPDIVGIGPRWIDQHRDMILAAAERGIHVYMEKPFCRTLAEADEIVAACERTHIKLAIAHQTHYSPKTAVVKQLLAEGKIGRVLEFRGRGKEDASRGGGEDLWVLGSHILDLIRFLGGDPSWCQGVVQREGRPIQKRDVQEGNEGIGLLAGDEVHATFGLASGAIARFDSVRGAAAKLSRFGLQIVGANGVIEILTGSMPSVKYLDDGSWSPGRSGALWQNVSSAGIGAAEPLADGGLDGGNVLAVKDLIAAIESDRQPLCGPVEGRGTVEMIAAIFESQRVGRTVPLPLENRQNPLALL